MADKGNLKIKFMNSYGDNTIGLDEFSPDGITCIWKCVNSVFVFITFMFLVTFKSRIRGLGEDYELL